MEPLSPPPKKVPKQLRIFFVFRPRREETVPNLISEAEKSRDVAIGSDNRNTANANENQCPDTSAAIDDDVDSGRDRDRSYIPIDRIRNDEHSFLDGNKWLLIENGKLGCAVCKQFDSFGPYMKQGQRMSKE